MSESQNDRAVVDAWLTAQRQDFLTGLRQRLDLDAGLHEALLTEQHTALTEKLRDTLDIEAGLAAIVPPDLTTIVDIEEDTESEGSLEWAASALENMPLPDRLTVRARLADRLAAVARKMIDPPVVRHDAHPSVERVITQAHVVEVATELESMFAVAADGGETTAVDRVAAYYRESFKLEDPDSSDVQNRQDEPLEAPDGIFDLAWPRIVHLRPTLESGSGKTESMLRWLGWEITPSERDRGRSIVHGPAWIEACGEFVLRMLYDDALMESRAELTEAMNRVASHLAYLEQMLNDFQGVDLREVELAGVNLDGLRWADATTLWPETWIEEIKRDSVHLGDGVYEISYGTSAHRDSLV